MIEIEKNNVKCNVGHHGCTHRNRNFYPKVPGIVVKCRYCVILDQKLPKHLEINLSKLLNKSVNDLNNAL